MPPLPRYLDPRRSLAAAIGWLVFALSIGLVLVASLWLGDMVRDDLLEQRERQLERMADRVVAELNLNLALRMQSVRALAALLATELGDESRATLRRSLENLQRASPEFTWIGVANAQGRILAATQGLQEDANVADQSWFVLGLKPSRFGDVQLAPGAATTPTTTDGAPGTFVDLIASVIDAKGVSVGVIGTRLKRRWLLDLAGSLGQALRGSTDTEALLLDRDGTVLIGPPSLEGKRWTRSPQSTDAAVPVVAVNGPTGTVDRPLRVDGPEDGSGYLIARATPAASDALHALGWRVVVRQPLHDAARRARTLQGQIAAVLLGLGLFAALLGTLLARHLTRALESIARSADAVRTGDTQRIAVPPGRNEAARLGQTLDDLLASLQCERSALQSLNAELDQRVAARTREIERLGELARYAAVVRERLKIARDLHDTLAHSMMAMLTETRLLKRLLATNPGALAEELTRAEETAHQGLIEARAAIGQMRFNPVRDVGLASALGDFVKLFVERTGIAVDYTSDAQAGAFADERAETLFRIAEEAMRNIERHAGATRVTISLREPPDGRGLTLTIADNGVGFDVETSHSGHYGLAGLHEQAQLIGAILAIQSAPQQGTTISVVLTVVPGLDS